MLVGHIARGHVGTVSCTSVIVHMSIIKVSTSVIEKKQTLFHSASIPPIFSSHKGLSSIRTHISLNTVWRKITQDYIPQHWAGSYGTLGLNVMIGLGQMKHPIIYESVFSDCRSDLMK